MVATSFQVHSEVDTSLQANLRADSAGGKKNQPLAQEFFTSLFGWTECHRKGNLITLLVSRVVHIWKSQTSSEINWVCHNGLFDILSTSGTLVVPGVSSASCTCTVSGKDVSDMWEEWVPWKRCLSKSNEVILWITTTTLLRHMACIVAVECLWRAHTRQRMMKKFIYLYLLNRNNIFCGYIWSCQTCATVGDEIF